MYLSKQGKTELELAKVQRLACLCITGAMKSSPTAALEALLNLPPLHLLMQAEARLGAYRLKQNHVWRQRPYGHARIEGRICDPVLEMISDWSPVTYKFESPFTTCLKPPNESEIRPVQELEWFTDGSVMNGRSGAGVCGGESEVSISMPLGTHTTIFQAEVAAITICAMENIRMGYVGKNIRILSDSQAAILAVGNCRSSSKLVLECQGYLETLAEHNRVEVGWVPGHKGHAGNEKADSLARLGSAHPLSGPEPGVGVTKSAVKRVVNDWISKQQISHWRNTAGQRHSKLLVGQPCPALAAELLRLRKKELRTVVGLITGHCGLRKHLHNMGIYLDNPVCRKCGEEAETATHVIFNCDAHTRWRLRFGPSLTRSGNKARAKDLVQGLILLSKRYDLN